MKRFIEVTGANLPDSEKIITPDALRFIADLQGEFGRKRLAALAMRDERQKEFDAGKLPDFLPETADIRASDWRIAAVPGELANRRVEITAPASSRKMVPKAFNSGANVYMADSEDSESPTWKNIVNGQINLYDAVRRQLIHYEGGKEYRLNDQPAVLFYRPRGWHLEEKHMTVDGWPVSASLFDFGLYFFHNARELLWRGHGPYFYLPKIESHYEARLWDEVFVYAEDYLDIPRGSIKATVLIETLPAAFEMDEILWELREHSAGLNCGRWDYIFSYIKKLRNHPEFVLPDRAQLTMDRGFLAAYVRLLIKTCHRRGAHAMGGMAAQIPIKNDQTANITAMINVRADKAREVKAGHDGTWVAHPALVPLAKEIFDLVMKKPNQLDVLREDVIVTAKDLLEPIKGEVTEAGVRTNISVGIRYLESWLSGNGAAAINNLMEDAATAEICRTQIWQWLCHGALIQPTFSRIAGEEIEKLPAGALRDIASELFQLVAGNPDFQEFLTIPGYELLLGLEDQRKKATPSTLE